MGTRQIRLAEAVLTCSHNLFFEQKIEKYHIFCIYKLSFLQPLKLRIIHRHVSVMLWTYLLLVIDARFYGIFISCVQLILSSVRVRSGKELFTHSAYSTYLM